MLSEIRSNPFRIFFSLGAFFAIIGIGPWLRVRFQSDYYPLDLHRTIMTNGFLLSFVTGFLMTAFPRSSKTAFADWWEIAFPFIFLIVAVISSVSDNLYLHHVFVTLTLSSLLLFCLRRYYFRQNPPPKSFIFVAVALMFWLSSSLLLALLYRGLNLPNQLVFLSHEIVSNAAVMGLVMGIGGRILPMIFGRPNVNSEFELPIILITLFGFYGSFCLYGVFDLKICQLVRAIFVTFYAMTVWKLHLKPNTRTYLSWGLWFAGWFLVLGYVLSALWSVQYTHAIHAILILGFSLITLLISVRVTLAHSGADLDLERSSKKILLITVLIIGAGLTRIFAPMLPQTYLSHLAYASLLWLLGLGCWLWLLMPILFRSKNKA